MIYFWFIKLFLKHPIEALAREEVEKQFKMKSEKFHEELITELDQWYERKFRKEGKK